jgi:hypothetical protein
MRAHDAGDFSPEEKAGRRGPRQGVMTLACDVTEGSFEPD